MKKKKAQDIKLETADITTKGLIIALGLSAVIIFVSVLMIYIGTPPQRIYAARVNGVPVTRDDYNNAVERMRMQYIQIMKMDFTTPSGIQMLDNIKRNTLKSMIDKEILVQAAPKFDIDFTSAEVQEEFDKIKKDNFNNDEKAFNETLKQNKLTVSMLKESIRKDKLVEKVKKKILDERAKFSDKELKDYYEANKAQFEQKEQVKASHILVKDEKLAEELYNEITKKGVDFGELAKKHSTDTGSKDKGGDLGFFEKGRMVPEFEKEAWALKDGEVSKPVKSQFGYHIIKKTGYLPAKLTTFEGAKKQVMDALKEKKSNEVIDKFVEEEKAKSKIEDFVFAPPPVVQPTVNFSPAPQQSVSSPANSAAPVSSPGKK